MIEGIPPFHPKPAEEAIKLMCLEGKRPPFKKLKSYPSELKEWVYSLYLFFCLTIWILFDARYLDWFICTSNCFKRTYISELVIYCQKCLFVDLYRIFRFINSLLQNLLLALVLLFTSISTSYLHVGIKFINFLIVATIFHQSYWKPFLYNYYVVVGL